MRIHRGKVVAAACVSAAAACPCARAQTDALFFEIEAQPGWALTVAHTVSPDGGLVVGRTYGEVYPGAQEGPGIFRWTPWGGSEILLLEDGTSIPTSLVGASYDGRRVFGNRFTPTPLALISGWYWTESAPGSGSGPMVIVPDDPYGTSEFFGGSGDGSVLVGFYNAPRGTPNTRDALRWSEADGYQSLAKLDPSHTGATARDCSDDGNIVVGQSGNRAVAWDVAAGTVTDMEVGPEGGMAFAVSPNGVYAAGHRVKRLANPPFPDSLVEVGFIWDAAQGMRDLDPFGFSNLVVPTAVSDDGRTVVGAMSGQLIDHPWGDAFIWTESRGFEFFEDYLLDLNVTNADLSGWTFRVIHDVSADGRIMVGEVQRPDGAQRGFVLYVGVEPPPGPSCVCEADGASGVNVFDLLAYLDGWFVMDAAADIDGQPGVNVFDLLFFLDCWFPASAGAAC